MDSDLKEELEEIRFHINQIAKTQNAWEEEKHQEMVDSVNYAKRIQEAILPPIEEISKFFEDSVNTHHSRAGGRGLCDEHRPL